MMSEDPKKAEAFGEFLLTMMRDFKNAEDSLPDGFAPDELSSTISTPEGDWVITVSRPEDEDSNHEQ